MIEKTETERLVCAESGHWQAVHDVKKVGGPQRITFDKEILAEDISCYLDDVSDDLVLVKKVRDFHKGHASIINAKGKLPFGGGVVYEHTYRYYSNRVRVTTDVNIPAGTAIKRHFGIGSMFLPGRWTKMFVLPASQHQVEGASSRWIHLPEPGAAAVMTGHWHRPPLIVVFIRSDGLRFEVGTGSDLWRWEGSLGYQPESGSYKVIVEKDGIRLIREPLMCCESFEPKPGNYRFSWYMAWDRKESFLKKTAGQRIKLPINLKNELQTEKLLELLQSSNASVKALELNLNDFLWQKSFLRYSTPADYIREEGKSFCWMCPGVVKVIKRIIRQLLQIDGFQGIVFRGFNPGLCYNSSHVNKKKINGLAHWDMNSLLDFCAWVNDQCADKLRITTDISPEWDIPSLRGLF